MVQRKKTNELAFIKAYEVILKMRDLNNAEKLVLITLCRYWPNPSWQKNETIAELLGFTTRYVEKIIQSLAEEKKKIKRGFAHRKKGNKIKTCRVIVPTCLPGKCNLEVQWIKPEHMDGLQSEQMDGCKPNNCSLQPEQTDDLLEIDKKKNKKQMPPTMPAVGQAPAFNKKAKHAPLTPEQIEQRKQKLIQDLREDEGNHKRAI